MLMFYLSTDAVYITPRTGGDTINVGPKPITFKNGQEISKTRMHSSRMLTTRSLQYGGLPDRDPLDRDPLPEQRPPGQRPPCLDRDP